MMDLSAITSSSAFATARDCVRVTDERTVRDMIEATQIPAPGGAESVRGAWLAERMRTTGLDPVVDDVGNVICVTPAALPDAPSIVVAAHLDTVFDADTDVTVHRDGDRLAAPGISDNGRGLAGILALARALSAAGWPTRVPVTLLATVGEEGAGDLRGAKHFMAAHARNTAAFIALDGAGAARIIHGGVGSRRLRATFTGPGGHSWSDWGRPNAVHAAADAVSRLFGLSLPAEPRTTLTVARTAGGTSINAIPAEAWIEIDIRCEAPQPLHELEQRTREVLAAAAAAACTAGFELTCGIEVIGDRPPGRTAADETLVRTAEAATRVIGLSPRLASSSTDANVAMAAGIPAIAIGAGGDAGGMHTPAEWYDNTNGTAGIERALLVSLAAAGLRSDVTAVHQP